jgi:hypothetical protein
MLAAVAFPGSLQITLSDRCFITYSPTLKMDTVSAKHWETSTRLHGNLNLVLCILLRVLDQVQGFPSNATLFQ